MVLDSFAGSGTTGHAVLELNDQDKGKRKFVLVQLRHDTKEQEHSGFNVCREVTAERVRRVIKGYKYKKGSKQKTETVPGLNGAFGYAALGGKLFGEYRDMGEQLPAFQELAKYIFYTETSNEFDKTRVNETTGKIGERKGISYYLLYSPNTSNGRPLDWAWLKSLPGTEKSRQLVVYCDKLWLHREDLAIYEAETGRKVRPMLIPFNLK